MNYKEALAYGRKLDEYKAQKRGKRDLGITTQKTAEYKETIEKRKAYEEAVFQQFIDGETIYTEFGDFESAGDGSYICKANALRMVCTDFEEDSFWRTCWNVPGYTGYHVRDYVRDEYLRMNVVCSLGKIVILKTPESRMKAYEYAMKTVTRNMNISDPVKRELDYSDKFYKVTGNGYLCKNVD